MPGMAISSWPEKNPPSIGSTFDLQDGDFKRAGFLRAIVSLSTG
jgi:hypothetical protein